MAGLFGVGAAVFAAVAAVAVVAPDGGPGTVPLFVALTLGGALHAWATAAPPVQGARRITMLAVTGLWMIAAVWIGALLLLYQYTSGIRGTPPPEVTYLGLNATVYHLIGLYGGFALVAIGTRSARTGPAPTPEPPPTPAESVIG